jgi:hypothetical protein
MSDAKHRSPNSVKSQSQSGLGLGEPVSRPAQVVGILAAVALGAFFRLYHLDAQVLTGDELHAVMAALAWPIDEIASTWTYYGADYGVPLALLYRAALDVGIQLGELELRIPVLLTSLISIALMPWLLRDRLGTPASLLFAVAIATSPLLVLYGRLVRSYAPAVLFAFIAVACFEHWRRTRSQGAGAAYCVGASLAIWFNLTSAPFVAAPMVYHLVRLVMQRSRDASEWTAALGLGISALVAVALPLLPARESLLGLGEIHGRGGLPSADTWLEIVRMHAGARSPWLAALVVAATLRGAWITLRDSSESREWLGLIAFAAAFHVVGLVVLGPDQLDNPIVINRYLLVLLPFGLSFAALGAASPMPRLPKPAHALGIALVITAICLTGPTRLSELGSTSFGNAPTYTYFVRDGNTVAASRLPSFYLHLANAKGAAKVQPILEYPWFNVATHAFDAYQKHHGQPVLVAPLSSKLADPRLALRNMVTPRAREYLASEARWLVVHLNLQNEERAVDTSDRNHWMRLEKRPAIWNPLLAAGPATARTLEGRFGPADFAEDGLRVWDLERLRAR